MMTPRIGLVAATMAPSLDGGLNLFIDSGSRPPRGHVRRLAQWQLLDEECRDESQSENDEAGHKHGMQGVRQAMTDAGRNRRRQVGELRGIEHGTSAAGRGLESFERRRRKVARQ